MNVDGPTGSIIAIRDSLNPENEPAHELGDDCAYHQARVQAEMRAANEAASPQTRQIHQRLADEHSKIAAHVMRRLFEVR